ncbi:MAG: polyphosphate kinase 1, partial [Lewinella sp.]
MDIFDSNIPFIARDISWLSFNYRVLQEAKDPSVPLFERIKFLAIYSSNLDEFFRVRMANHRNLIRIGRKTKRQLHISPKQTVRTIQKIVDEQQEEFARIFATQIIPELRKHKIIIKRRMDLDEDQQLFVEDYFRDHMLPFVQPVLLVKDKIRPFLNNAQLYLSILLQDKDAPDSPS